MAPRLPALRGQVLKYWKMATVAKPATVRQKFDFSNVRIFCYDLGAGSTKPATRVTTVMIAVLAERPFMVALSSYTIIKDHRGLSTVSFYYINSVLLNR